MFREREGIITCSYTHTGSNNTSWLAIWLSTHVCFIKRVLKHNKWKREDIYYVADMRYKDRSTNNSSVSVNDNIHLSSPDELYVDIKLAHLLLQCLLIVHMVRMAGYMQSYLIYLNSGIFMAVPYRLSNYEPVCIYVNRVCSCIVASVFESTCGGLMSNFSCVL